MIIFVLAFLYQSAYDNDYTERGEFLGQDVQVARQLFFVIRVAIMNY